MMPDTRPMPALYARAAIAETKLARVLSRMGDMLDLLEATSTLSKDNQVLLDELRETIAEARA